METGVGVKEAWLRDPGLAGVREVGAATSVGVELGDAPGAEGVMEFVMEGEGVSKAVCGLGEGESSSGVSVGDGIQLSGSGVLSSSVGVLKKGFKGLCW